MTYSTKGNSIMGSLTLRAKINLAIAIIFLTVIGTVTGYTVHSEKERALNFAEKETKNIATFYFDGLNTMMLTSTMDQRTILRNKILNRDNVLDARVIRGESVSKQFGPGLPEEQPADELDHRALKGEEIVLVENGKLNEEGKTGRTVTVLAPFRATEAKQPGDVNCLACHNVPEGTVNGAIRVSYSIADQDAEIEKGQLGETVANVVLLVFGLLLANLLLRRWISKPLSNIMEVVTKRAEGDTSLRIKVTSGDEIGKLSIAFNNMADKVDAANEQQHLQAMREHELTEELKRKVDILLDVVNKAARGDLTGSVTFSGDDAIGGLGAGLQMMVDNLRQLMEERRMAMEELQNNVDTMQAVVKKAAQGDLTGKIEIDSDDAVGQLAKGIQGMIDNLNRLVGQVLQSGIQVTSSSTEIAASAKQQEATVAEQAATVNQIVATATEISATSKELVMTMNEVAEVSTKTAEAAASSQIGLASMEETMRNIVNASGSIATKLEVLSEKAGNINSVVTTITKVADQTNLLSLNAAIEAEKAGEYGVGFAVVATEIRRLADQTAVATLDIEQMVKEMQSAVSAGVMSVEKFSKEVQKSVDVIQRTGAQLTQITEQVQALTPRFDSVHEGMHMQADGAEQIKLTMIQLSAAAQQTVESLRQSHVAIERLNDAAHGLRGGVSIFKVKSD